MAVAAGMVLRLTEAALTAMQLQASQRFGTALFDMPAGALLNRVQCMLSLIVGQETREDCLQPRLSGHDESSSFASRSVPVLPSW